MPIPTKLCDYCFVQLDSLQYIFTAQTPRHPAAGSVIKCTESVSNQSIRQLV